MSTERRRNAGGRRRASGPSGDQRGGGRRRAESHDGDDGGFSDDGGFWDDERPSRRRADTGRAEAGQRGGGRRPDPERGGRRAAAHGARAESGQGGRRAAGGARRRPTGRGREYDDRGPVKRFLSKAWKPALIVCGLGFVAGVAFLGIAYMVIDIPDDAQAAAKKSSTQVQFDNDKEAVALGATNRQMVSADEIPPEVKDGVLAAEQKNFYEEPGISVTGTMRAVLTGGQAGGGSTITQQMARNYYDGLSQERSYTRKFKEIIISIKVGKTMEPDEILARYLNTIYLGRGAYGIQAASQEYFGKNVQDLNASEGAVLGAMIQQPGNFEKVDSDPEAKAQLKKRWEGDVLKRLVEMNKENADHGLPQNKVDQLTFPKIKKWDTGDKYTGYKGYIKSAVESELKDRYKLDDSEIATGGYTVKTSLNKRLMDAADHAFDDLPEGMPKETETGLASVDPKTGEVKAFKGGDGWPKDDNDSLTHRAQAGSAFKPYTLATGLKQDIGLKSTFDGDSPRKFPGVKRKIQNDSGKSYGSVDLIQATADSVNTAYVDLATETEPKAIVETAKDSGIPKKQFETADLGPNITLGTYQVTALDQAAGFSTFANEGVHMPQHMVTSVTRANGEKIEPKDADTIKEGKEAFSKDVAADATHAMTKVLDEGHSGDKAKLSGRPAAGKTGTSNSAKSAWFVGYTPQLSTSVGLSRHDGKKLDIPGVPNVYGGTTSGKIWKKYMTEAMKGRKVEKFPPPAWVGETKNKAPTEEPSEEQQSQTDQPSSTTPSRPTSPSQPESPSGTDSSSDGPCPPTDPNCDEDGDNPPDDPSGGPGDGGDGGGDWPFGDE